MTATVIHDEPGAVRHTPRMRWTVLWVAACVLFLAAMIGITIVREPSPTDCLLGPHLEHCQPEPSP